MGDETEPKLAWSTSPSAKAKHAIQRSVNALLDQLAPERVLRRGEEPPVAIEEYRTPSGCVLQAPNAALSVSWFADTTAESRLGELHIVVWRGKVTRRGAPPSKPATQVSELIVRPVEAVADASVWETSDGLRHDTASLAARCIALLDEQTRI
jgi:hypothetical protein